MTDQEKYRRAFGVLHTSDAFLLEEKAMEKKKKRFILPRAAVATVTVCVILAAMLSVAYAADIGGLKQTIDLWIRGESRQATLEQIDDGMFSVMVKDEYDQIEEEFTGGGMEIDENGNEHAISADEYAEYLESEATIENTEDGRIMLYYYDQKVDITDRFDDNGICKIKLIHENEEVYFTIESIDNGEGYSYLMSRDGFDMPGEQE